MPESGRLTVSVGDEIVQMLDEYCNRTGEKKTALVRRLIRQYIEGRPTNPVVIEQDPELEPVQPAEDADIQAMAMALLRDSEKEYKRAILAQEPRAIKEALKGRQAAITLLNKVLPDTTPDVNKLPSTREAAARGRAKLIEAIHVLRGRRDTSWRNVSRP